MDIRKLVAIVTRNVQQIAEARKDIAGLSGDNKIYRHIISINSRVGDEIVTFVCTTTRSEPFTSYDDIYNILNLDAGKYNVISGVVNNTLRVFIYGAYDMTIQTYGIKIENGQIVSNIEYLDVPNDCEIFDNVFSL